MKNTTIHFLLLLFFVFLLSCNQESKPVNQVQKEADKTITTEKAVVTSNEVTTIIKSTKKRKAHPYGGWSCPDNVFGFPPVDVSELDKIPVVNGRLPTKEETKNGTSLMFFDTSSINAKPLDMKMPRLARYYSEYTKKNELVVVIQAVEARGDTIVGFRYANGGNGSAWFDEVDFLTDDAIKEVGSTYFISQTIYINADRGIVWDVMTNPKYAKTLGANFAKDAYVESDWMKDSKVHFKYAPDQTVSTGIITALWNNLYTQIDYDFNGDHYVEKFLMMNGSGNKTTRFHLVCGPFKDDFEMKKIAWMSWLDELKKLSEINAGTSIIKNIWTIEE